MLYYYLLLFLGIVTSIFLIISNNCKTSNEKKENVTAFAIHPSYQNYNKKGQLHLKVNAQSVKQFTNSYTSTFIKPKITIYNDEHFFWHITSDQAESKNQGEKILLYGHVKLHQPKQKQHADILIKTDQLVFYPMLSFAKTNKKVNIRQKNIHIDGKGMQVDFKKGIVNLADSKGIYRETN